MIAFFKLFLFFYFGVTYIFHPILNLICGLILLIFTLKEKNRKQLLFYFISCLLGFSICFLFTFINQYFYFNFGMVIYSKENYFIFQTITGRYYVYLENNPYEVFDFLKIDGELIKYHFQTYESQFDFNQYLRNYYVFYQIDKVVINPLFINFFRFRGQIEAFLSVYDSNVKSFLSLLIFNVSDQSIYSETMYENNLNYYLSISSFHLYFLLEITSKLLRIKIKERFIKPILITLILFILVLSNYKLSILRLLLFYTLSYYLEVKNLRLSRVDKISIVFLICGILNPASLTGTSFYYSFPLLIFLYYLNTSFRINNINNSLLFIIFINIFLIPINVYFNGYFTLLSLFYSLLISPYVLMIFCLSLLSLIIPLSGIVNFLSQGIINLTLLVSEYNFKIYVVDPNYIFYGGFYLILISLIYFLEIKRINNAKNLTYALFIFTLISTWPINNYNEQAVYFINVGQGDSILIKNRNKNYLIDTGGSHYTDLAVDSLIPFFRKKGINKIEKVFITHLDYDHVGALESLNNNFSINEVVYNYNFKEIKYQNFYLTNLNTDYYHQEEENDRSLVLYLKFNKWNFLFMGDASKNIEKEIINKYPNLEVDYLKVGHHGSNTSTSDEFLEQYQIKEAIISVGKNYYNHPSFEVMERLKNHHIRIRRTDLEGTIKYRL